MPWLLAALGSDHRSAWAFVRALRAIRDPRAIPGLRDVARRPGNEWSDWARTEAIAALSELSAREAVPDLRMLLTDKSEGVRERAAEALREFGHEADAKPGSYGPASWRRQVTISLALSAAVAVPLWRWGVTPLTDSGWAGNRWWSLWMLAAIYGAVLWARRGLKNHERWERLGRRGQTAAAGLAVPLSLAGAALWLAPAHAAQNEAAVVFGLYTHRFPAGALGEPFIERHSDRYLTSAPDMGARGATTARAAATSAQG